MILRNLAKERYVGRFVFVCGYYEGAAVFVLECFDSIKDRRGEDTFMVSFKDPDIKIPVMEVSGESKSEEDSIIEKHKEERR